MKKSILTFLILSFLFLSGSFIATAIPFSFVNESGIITANDEEPVPPWVTKP